MRFRSALLVLLLPVLFLWNSAAFAQKRVFSTVNPNAATINKGADLYNPVSGMFVPAAEQMNVARERHVAVALGDGDVLFAGGYNNRPLKDAEVFNSATGSFIKTDSMATARFGAAAVRLQRGRVLVVGGYNGNYLASAEYYDSPSRTFDFTSGSMITARYNPTATLLNDGNVLITGGFNGAFLSSAEIYNATCQNCESFTATAGLMSEARDGHTATLLSDGRVLIAGGCNNTETERIVCDRYLNSAEIYDPSTGEFTDTGSMNKPRRGHTATLLPNGNVLIAGGTDDGTSILNTSEIYDPATGQFAATGDMGTARSDHTATSLPDGRVLLAGGGSNQYLRSAEIYNPDTGTFSPVSSSMAIARYRHSATALSDGRILLAGGQNSDLLSFDTNIRSLSDNISPNIVYSSNYKMGFVPYTGSGVVLAFSTETGDVLGRIYTGGQPASLALLPDGRTLAAVSALDNRIFVIDMDGLTLRATYSFEGLFGFGSILALSPDGSYGYISSTGTGEVIKFDISSGNEVGRLKDLSTPAQITVTKDGGTLVVVDTSANEVVFADSSLMIAEYKMTTAEVYPGANFTIFNKAILNSDESYGVIGSQDTGLFSGGTLLFFDASTGEIVRIELAGIGPGFTVLRPDGTAWLILCQNTLTVASTSGIPADDLNNPSVSIVQNIATVRGNPLGFANIVFSSDWRYAFYTSSTSDLIFQHDLSNHAVVGAFLVGDDPNDFVDQAASLAIDPNTDNLVVLNFASNELDLLTDEAILRQTKFISQQDQFSGLSITNLSDQKTSLTITAMADGGSPFVGEDLTNPVDLQLAPNAQASLEVGQLFNFDNQANNSGRIVIEADQGAIAGFSNTGQIRAEFLGAYVSGFQGIPFASNYRDKLYDWIVPEMPRGDVASAELNFVNPNYNPSNYEWIHYGADGAILESNTDSTINGSIREVISVSNFLTTSGLGRVLITGGFDGTSAKGSADLFDPTSNTFLAVGSRLTPRYGHSSTWLSSGKVLLAGGKDGLNVLNTAALYDRVDDTFLETAGTMNHERYRHTATALLNGKVLIAGGQDSVSITGTAELFDPISRTFKPTSGIMTTPRDAHTATRLSDGKVLLAGGIDGSATSSTAEIYDPDSSLFILTGAMSDSRAFHSAIKLLDGKVLIAGGYNGSYLNSAELYDPATGLFSPTSSMTVKRSNHSGTLLSDGRVLVAGGRNSSGPLNSAEIYDPGTGTFTAVGEMVSARAGHTATLVPNSDGTGNDLVFIAGGSSDEENAGCECNTLDTAEIYNPVAQQFTAASGTMTEPREGHAATFVHESDGGYLRMKSSEGLLFTEIFSFGGADAALSGINVDKYSGITKIYSPQFAIVPPFVTILNIINGNQSDEAEVTITLHAPDGRVLATPVTQILPQNGQIRGSLWKIFGNDPNLQNRSGWLEVESSVDSIIGVISFTRSDDSFLASFELSGIPLNDFLFPLVSEDSDFQTGVALLNNGELPAHAQLELWGSAGTLDGLASLTLVPHTRSSLYLADYFSGMQPHRSANLRIHSDQPLHGLAILHDRNVRFISSVPPVPYPEQ
jgi:deoxycytidylate deaminase